MTDAAMIRVRAEAGLARGARASDTVPALKPRVLGRREGRDVLDRSATRASRAVVLSRVTQRAEKGGRMRRVATDPSTSRRRTGRFQGVPQASVVNTRWMGGRFTNRETRRARAEDFLEKEKTAGYELSKAARKRYQLHFRSMEPWLLSPLPAASVRSSKGGLPSRVFFFQAKAHGVAIHEAALAGRVTAGRVNTDCPARVVSELTYPIPANDHGVEAAYRVARLLREACHGR